MSPIKRFSLVVIFILSLMSCSDSKTSYYRTWQEGHHLSDSLMVDFYGEENAAIENVLGLVLEAIDGNWEKVEEMTSGSRKIPVYTSFRAYS